MHNHTLQKYTATITIFISFFINVITNFQWSLIRVALMQYEKHYTSLPIGAAPS